MEEYKKSALQIADYLMQIKAVKLNVNEPFVWASGWKSPIYCDNRKILSFPKVRDYVKNHFTKVIREQFPNVEVIAGVATGAIAVGVLVAQEMGLPFVYVRPSEKKHGLGNKIEGVIEKGQSVVVIEDLVSTGKSSLNAVDALREADCNVLGLIANFTYGFDLAGLQFKNANCKLLTLTNYNYLIEIAVQNNAIKKEDMDTLMEWRKNPSEWGV